MLKLTTSLAFALAAFAAVPALAEDMMMKDGMMHTMQPDGHMTMMTPSGDQMKMMQDAMMKQGTEMTGTMIIMMHDGHMMMMDDMKMDDGKMMSDHMMMK